MSRTLTALGPRHHAAIRLKLNGASGAAIAQSVGVKRRTVYLWMGDPLVKHELERQLERLNDEVALRLAAAALAGLEELTGLLGQPNSRSPDPMEKLAIGTEILDRYERLRQEHRLLKEQRMMSQLQRIVSQESGGGGRGQSSP